jgi:chromosome transmission fidelity protein 4
MSATEQATVAMSAPPTAIIETDLKLDNDEDHPRRLLKLPTGQVLAYGGDDGTVTLVASSSTGKSVQATAARRFDDDAVRALAVSANGKRVAVGFDSGATVIYTYEDFDLMSNDNDNNNKHPFLPEPTATDNGEMSQDNLFSQSDALTAGAVSPGETDFAGPCFDSPVRDLLFLNDYNLAIATESETGFCVVNVTCGKSLSQRYLQEQAVKAHDNAGVRSLAIVAGGSSSSSRLLASLGLDGRLCLWNVSAGDPAVWELVRRDSSCCVTKKDVGEILGADAWDRSCRPQFLSCLDAESAVLALPGATYLQLRSVSTDQKTVTDHDQPPTGDDATTGHIESIVTMAISPAASDPFVVTSGRDGRVIMWEIVRNKVRSVSVVNVCVFYYGYYEPTTHPVCSFFSLQEDETLDATFVRQLGQFDSEPTSLLWDKDKHGEESLFVACANGTLMTIQGRQNIAPKAAKKAKVTKTTAVPATDKQTKHSVEEQLSRLSKKSPMDDAMDSDDDNVVFDVDDQNDAPRPASRFMDDEAADDESTSPANESGAAPSADKASPSNARRTYDSQDDDDDDEDDFEMPTVNAHHQSNMHYKTMDLPEPQPAFAPSSTPLELTRRYMCWNHIGAVTLLQGELGMSRSTVDIDFTDSAFRRPISFTDNMGFILGSLGEDGAIFATDVTDDDDMDGNVDNDLDDVVNNMSEATKAAVKRSQRSREGGAKATGSTVYFHRFETFGALRDKDWYLTLPAGERALGCACGESWAAVVTRFV